MKVLVTHELFPPDVHGGGEKVVFEIAKRLKENGIEVMVLTTGNPMIKDFKGIRTVRLPINRYLMNLVTPWICRYAKDFDVIQTNNYNACFPSFLAGKILHKPVVCLVHEVYNKKWIKFRGLIFGTLSRIVERLQVRHDFDKFIFLSNYMRDSAIEIGIKREKTEVIKPGIEFKRFISKKKEPFVLFVGNLTKRKGAEQLVKVAKDLEKINFYIVGEGDERKKLEGIAPNNVHFLGHVSEKRLLDLFSRASVFCLPSFGEGFGIVLLEAMASGCAIVSTIPLEYDGIRIDADDIDQLRSAIKHLIENPKIVERMGKKNREIAETYSWDNFIKKLIEIYKELL